jgi:hypothetical protein
VPLGLIAQSPLVGWKLPPALDVKATVPVGLVGLAPVSVTVAVHVVVVWACSEVGVHETAVLDVAGGGKPTTRSIWALPEACAVSPG